MKKRKLGRKTHKKVWRKIGIAVTVFVVIGVLGLSAVLGINAYVVHKAAPRIMTSEQTAELENVDCILVLGCLVKESGQPSDMLADRLRRGVELYQNGAAPKLLMSGDHGREDYNEVQAMKQYAIDEGIASGDIFMDHAGFSTYESIYRAKEIFGAEKILIVSQEYHLYRALYVAQALGVEAYGVASDYHNYLGQTARDIREILARNKDFFTAIFRPEPRFLGEETYPVSGNGDMTND
jgi:vancomycin permeability regulator SanA